MEIISFFLLFFAAYLIGSIPFGLILTKVFAKQDIRSIGSGNIGATNVLRTGNKVLAIITLLLDASKGAIAMLVLSTQLIAPGAWLDCIGPCGINWPYYETYFIHIPFLLGVFAIIGHCYPVWLKFKGGKGVATTLGVLLSAVPIAGLAACLVWLITAFIFKISSLAALVAAAITPIIVFFVYGTTPAIVCVLISALLFWKHRENIQRLMAGIESKINFKKKD